MHVWSLPIHAVIAAVRPLKEAINFGRFARAAETKFGGASRNVLKRLQARRNTTTVEVK